LIQSCPVQEYGFRENLPAWPYHWIRGGKRKEVYSLHSFRDSRLGTEVGSALMRLSGPIASQQ
jgi:hypothetical protein